MKTDRPRCAPTRVPKSAQALESALRGMGFTPGYPPHVTPMTRAVDQQTARRMKCPGCKRRGLGSKPYHKGPSFRVLAVCPVCLLAEEA